MDTGIRLGQSGIEVATVRLARLQPFLAYPLAPDADRGALKRQLVPEKLLTAEY